MTNDKEKRSALEAFLFLSGDVLTLSTLKDVTGLTDAEVKKLMSELIDEYRERDGGLLIAEIAGGYQMVTNPVCADWVKKFRSTQISSKLSMPALETLAIIAYKQPIIRAEIEQIRGVNGTTREFLQYFGLKDLTELPTLKDLIREEAA
jgi:segregation and condensation protein B